MKRRQSASPALSFWLLVALILFLALALRLIDITRLPLFLDEALHLRRAHFGMQGHFYSWNIRKWLYPVFLSTFRPGGPEAVWLSRGLSALLGVLTTGCCMALGRRFGRERAGLIAGLLYATLPLAVFHERQALADPLLAALLALSMVLSVRLARRPRVEFGVLIGLVLAAAYLTKISAFPFIGLPFLAMLFLGTSRTRWRALATLCLGLVIGAVVVILTYQFVLRSGGNTSSVLEVMQDRFIQLAIGEGEAADQAVPLASRLASGLEWFWGLVPLYLGVGLALLVILSALWAVRGSHLSEVIYLAVPGLAFALGPMLVTRPLDASRYFLPNAAALAMLAALSWEAAYSQIVTRWPGAKSAAEGAVLTLILVPALWFDLTLIAAPSRAPLTAVDHSQYFMNPPSGSGYQEIAQALVAVWKNDSSRSLDVLGPVSLLWVRGYLGPRVGEVESVRTDGSLTGSRLPVWLGRGDRVYYLDDGSEADPLPDHQSEVHMEPIMQFDGGFRQLRLFEIASASGALANEVYSQSVPDADLLESDYNVLSPILGQESMGRRVVVFPAGHASTVSARSGLAAEPLSIGAWPPSTEAVNAALDRLKLPAEPGLIDVVLVDETSADPERFVLLGLQDRFYRVSESWFGLLHRITYADGPADPPMSPVGAQFEGGIELFAASIVDPALAAGAPLRVVWQWRTPAQIQDSFNVFVHVVDESGTLRAQYDAIPGAGLFPMTSWQPGEIIEDRFAILLPADLAPGVYTIRAGIYNPASQLRLPVLAAPEASSDYIFLGHITVAPPE